MNVFDSLTLHLVSAEIVLHSVTRRPAVMGIGLCTQKVGADANILLPQPLPHYLLPSVKQARGNGQLYDEPHQELLLENRLSFEYLADIPVCCAN